MPGAPAAGLRPPHAACCPNAAALASAECPFANLPEAKAGRWGEGLTAAKMKECRWLKPALVGQFEFVEWTPDGHLRHSCYMGLREDKKPSEVVRKAGYHSE